MNIKTMNKIKDFLLQDEDFKRLVQDNISSYLDSQLDSKINKYVTNYIDNTYKSEIVNKIKSLGMDLKEIFQIKGEIK